MHPLCLRLALARRGGLNFLGALDCNITDRLKEGCSGENSNMMRLKRVLSGAPGTPTHTLSSVCVTDLRRSPPPPQVMAPLGRHKAAVRGPKPIILSVSASPPSPLFLPTSVPLASLPRTFRPLTGRRGGRQDPSLSS